MEGISFENIRILKRTVGAILSDSRNINAVSETGNDGRKVYQPPKLTKLSQDATESGIVILPIEILGIQGPS